MKTIISTPISIRRMKAASGRRQGIEALYNLTSKKRAAAAEIKNIVILNQSGVLPKTPFAV